MRFLRPLLRFLFMFLLRHLKTPQYLTSVLFAAFLWRVGVKKLQKHQNPFLAPSGGWDYCNLSTPRRDGVTCRGQCGPRFCAETAQMIISITSSLSGTIRRGKKDVFLIRGNPSRSPVGPISSSPLRELISRFWQYTYAYIALHFMRLQLG